MGFPGAPWHPLGDFPYSPVEYPLGGFSLFTRGEYFPPPWGFLGGICPLPGGFSTLAVGCAFKGRLHWFDEQPKLDEPLANGALSNLLSRP